MTKDNQFSVSSSLPMRPEAQWSLPGILACHPVMYWSRCSSFENQAPLGVPELQMSCRDLTSRQSPPENSSRNGHQGDIHHQIFRNSRQDLCIQNIQNISKELGNTMAADVLVWKEPGHQQYWYWPNNFEIFWPQQAQKQILPSTCFQVTTYLMHLWVTSVTHKLIRWTSIW